MRGEDHDGAGLQRHVRDLRAGYDQSMTVLRTAKAAAKEAGRRLYTKSSIMLGLGETRDEVRRAERSPCHPATRDRLPPATAPQATPTV